MLLFNLPGSLAGLGSKPIHSTQAVYTADHTAYAYTFARVPCVLLCALYTAQPPALSAEGGGVCEYWLRGEDTDATAQWLDAMEEIAVTTRPFHVIRVLS